MALCSFLLSISITFLAISIWFNSNDFKPAEFSLPPPPPLTGQLAVNKPKVLEKLLEEQVVGAESIVVENKNTLYTCTTDGKCLKIVNGKIVKTIPLTNHKDCHAMIRQTISYCGRPLGIRRFNANEFIVVDCVLGFFVVNFEKETKELILSSSINVAGKPQKFPDDFDFADNDTIIYSDASTRYGYVDFLLAFLEHSGDGRIIKYKMSTGQLDVLVDGLNFPNGVQIHPDKQSVLFCESATARIHRHYFAGPKMGRNEIFFDNLPGFPDNIRISASGKSFYVALFSHRNAEKPDFFQQTAGWPIARKVVGELLKILPQSVANLFFHQSHSSYGIVIELDLKGNILRSFHDPEGNVIKDISQISDDGDQFLYLASFANNYIGRMSKN